MDFSDDSAAPHGKASLVTFIDIRVVHSAAEGLLQALSLVSKLLSFAEKLVSSIHVLLREPPVGFYRLQTAFLEALYHFSTWTVCLLFCCGVVACVKSVLPFLKTFLVDFTRHC